MRYEAVPGSPPHSEFKTVAVVHAGLGWFIISSLGSTMHFIYEWSGCSDFAAVFCAVNESVYEHIKIMLFPMLFWWCGAVLVTSRLSDSLNAATGAMYLSLCLLLVGNAISQAAGFESLGYDIVLFLFCIFYGQLLGAAVFVNRWNLCWPFFLLAMVIMLFTFTFAPPKWPYLFEDHRNGTYGRPLRC